MESNQKFALITGATEGIGYHLTKLFAEAKYNLILVARHQGPLDNLANDLENGYKIKVHTITKDLIKRESPFEVYEEVKEKGFPVEVLVNNAAQGQFGEFIDTDIDRELDIVQLNIGGYISLTKCFLQDMINYPEAKILNVGSIAGELPGPWQAVYHGTKAFVNSWSEAIRNELKDSNISVTVLLPGPTDTEFFDKAEMENSKIVAEGDLADPAEVAKDGFDALMSGKDKIISGFKNKAMVAMGKILPDSMNANNMRKQQQPKEKDS